MKTYPTIRGVTDAPTEAAHVAPVTMLKTVPLSRAWNGLKATRGEIEQFAVENEIGIHIDGELSFTAHDLRLLAEHFGLR